MDFSENQSKLYAANELIQTIELAYTLQCQMQRKMKEKRYVLQWKTNNIIYWKKSLDSNNIVNQEKEEETKFKQKGNLVMAEQCVEEETSSFQHATQLTQNIIMYLS